MSTPEPNPYRQLNYPVNNLEQNFDQTKKIQVRANIGIPTSVNKAGQVLTVGNSTGELEWSTVSGGGDIPSSSSADEGKVLTVDSNGEPSWEEPQGGTQVQSDWTEDNSTDPAYIKHRPVVKNLIAGNGITITETAQGIVISLT